MIPFFTDENVPESASRFLAQSGHSVTRLSEVMVKGTADPVIAVACSRSGHVLVSHDTDFRQTAKRLQITQRQYRTSLHRIMLRCAEPDDVGRLQDALSLIEHEWALIREDRPMAIEIRASAIVTLR